MKSLRWCGAVLLLTTWCAVLADPGADPWSRPFPIIEVERGVTLSFHSAWVWACPPNTLMSDVQKGCWTNGQWEEKVLLDEPAMDRIIESRTRTLVRCAQAAKQQQLAIESQCGSAIEKLAELTRAESFRRERARQLSAQQRNDRKGAA